MPSTFLLDLLSLTIGDLVAAGLAALRIGAAVSVLPVLPMVPWRTRIAIAAVLGAALGSQQTGTVTTWSIANVISELATGAALGIGLRVTLSALQTAGTWIDEQTATGLTAEPSFPDSLDENSSGSAQVLTWIGAWVILTTPPWGGDLAVMQRALDSLTVVPLGTIVSPEQIPVWIVGLLRSWSDLAMGVALPVCLVAGLIQAGLSVLGRGLGVGIGQAMTPVRGLLTIALIVIVLPSQAEQIGEVAIRDQPSIINQSPVPREGLP